MDLGWTITFGSDTKYRRTLKGLIRSSVTSGGINLQYRTVTDSIRVL